MTRLKSAPRARFSVHDLGALIELYEASYTRLLRLAPDVDQLEGTVVSQVAGALELYLTVLERHKYTTTVNLTYRFHTPEGEAFLEPNARLCVYHDVRSVELLGHSRRRRVRGLQPWRRGRMPEVERKWEMNRFLLKWLKFCTHQGHMFLACTSRQDREMDRWMRSGAPGPVPLGL
jgi:uncharacterized protein